MSKLRANLVILAIASMLSVLAGCKSEPAPLGGSPQLQSKPKPSPVQPPPRKIAEASAANSGGCDERVGEIGALILLFGRTKYRLPESLDELRSFPGAQSFDFTCPVSKQPYIYVPEGIPTPSGKARIVLYDAVAAHAGMRLCLAIDENQQGGAMVVRPIALPDAFFKAREK